MIETALTLMDVSVFLIGLIAYCKICDVIAMIFFYDNYDFALIILMALGPFFIGGIMFLCLIF
jgi:hypothetical protein